MLLIIAQIVGVAACLAMLSRAPLPRLRYTFYIAALATVWLIYTPVTS